MDGVFMKKLIKLLLCLLLVVTTVSVYDLWQDHQTLKQDLIRLHVVANSDLSDDQDIKLQVKDAVVAYLEPIIEQFSDKEQVMEYLRENLAVLQELSNSVLDRLGIKQRAKVTLQQEAFGVREYDTFSLPSGMYDSLRIVIGDGEGKNWWCVAFPSLCLPATSADFRDTAVSSGFSQTLTNTLVNGGRFRVRFLFLDCIGKIENYFSKT